MENDKIIVGLDIGTTKICAIIGRKNEFGKLEVLGLGKAVSEGVKRGIVANIDKTVDAIEKAVNDASDMAEVCDHGRGGCFTVGTRHGDRI